MNDAADLIFISIAAYRDLQLSPTVEDCLAKARHPERLRFGICWQHGPEETSLAFAHDARFTILDVGFRASRGACWARSEVIKLWRGEPWFLQVDSHCRFAQDWDLKLIRAMAALMAPASGGSGSAKPILSTYASAFTPGPREQLTGAPMQMVLQGFNDDGVPFMKPMAMPLVQGSTAPRPARFLSAGFLFAPGSLVEEVGYDPELYFVGEETAMTVRAFTHGYDLFHPGETLVWHDYVRKDATKHWDDHTPANDAAASAKTESWGELDQRSRAKVMRLLRGEPVESYGLGSVRTLAEYERYAGISFALAKAQDATMRGDPPPNPEAPADWAEQIYTWMVRIRLTREALAAGSFDDPGLWYIGVRDEAGHEIFRRDLTRGEIETLAAAGNELVIVCELNSGQVPSSWTLWPFSRTLGWLSQISSTLPEEDFAILIEED